MATFIIRDETVLGDALSYDPTTGLLRWRIDRGKVKAGDIAGSEGDSHGYLSVRVNYRSYLVHRVAWFLTYGRFPLRQLDHINGNRRDNRLVNLREVTDSENSRNKRMSGRNTSGAQGVGWHSARGKWRAHIMVGRKQIHLGLFDEFADALAARKRAESELDFHPNHGRAA